MLPLVSCVSSRYNLEVLGNDDYVINLPKNGKYKVGEIFKFKIERITDTDLCVFFNNEYIEAINGEDSNFNYLKSTTDEIFFIHSIDDPTVGFKYLIPKVSKLNNPHLSFYIEEHKRHTPTYKVEAVKYKDKIINKYFKLSKKEKFHSEEERKNYFKDVSIDKLTETDPVVFTKIFEFIG